jgi:hypothetical protein
MRLRVKANLRTALIKGEEFYTWYVYDSREALELVTRNGKRSFSLRYGARFGIRPSHNGKEIRLVADDHGMTIVFTITPEAKEKLVSNSREVANVPIGVASAQVKCEACGGMFTAEKNEKKCPGCC